jgi:hypothetical protein
MSVAALATAPLPKKLRVGLFADARLQPRWVVEAFAKVAASEFAEIAVIATASAAQPATPWLWNLYGALDRRAFGAGTDPAERLDLGLYVPHEPPVLHAKMGSDPDYFLGLNLDVAFALGDLDDSWLDGLARYGVWRFCFGGERTDCEALAGVREVAEGAPLTGSGLKVRLAPGAEPRLAYQSWSRTYPFSVARNRDQLLAKTAEFAARALREAHRSGHGWLDQCPLLPNQRQTAISAPSPSPIFRRILRRGLEKALHVEQWFLGFRFANGEARAREDKLQGDLEGFVRLMPPKDRSWADPFALEKNGRYFVFFEELPFAAGKAHIAMSEVRRDGSWSTPVRVLERDYHLSYPFLLEQDGQLYMIPETAKNGTVELYRCVDFPLRWKLEKVLLQGVRLVDATIHRGVDRWWMFANAAAGASRVFDDELHLFYAERLLGEWQAHPRNPVKSDARCARPAGRLYWRNGALYRPAQICVPLYGAGLSINRVLRLTPQAYAERQVERVLPDCGRGILGLHTVNRAGALTVVDAFTRRRRFA